MKDAIPPGRIADDLRAIERWTKHGGVGDLAAQTAADAALDHGCHRIAAQRIGIGLDRERGTAGEPDAGMVAGANLVIDAEAHPHHALAAFELIGILRAHAALARELAFAVGDDDLEAALRGAHGLFQGLGHLGDAVAAHRAQPLDPERAQGLLDGHAGRGADAVGGARRQILLTGGGGVTVLHHDQHAVAFVEQVRGDAGDEPVMPEAPVAHDGDRAAVHIGRDRGRACQRHAVAEDGVAEAEGGKGRKRMAADVGADMGRSELALHQLDRGEHRALRASGAEVRRSRRNVAERGDCGRLMRQHFLRARRDRVAIDADRPRLRRGRRRAR